MLPGVLQRPAIGGRRHEAENAAPDFPELRSLLFKITPVA
jgi:hypothetical protein